MKRLSLWLAVGFVLFSFQGGFARPTQAQLDSLRASLKPVAFPTRDKIRYDTVEIGGQRHSLDSNYWIAVKFTPVGYTFNLKAIDFQVDNSWINTSRPCTLFVATDKNNRPDSLKDTLVVPTPPSELTSARLRDTTRFVFAEDQNFWILLGPVPGGQSHDTISDGWWAVKDTIVARGRSFISRDFTSGDGSGNWNSLTSGNWVIRAGGEYFRQNQVVINEVMFNPDRRQSDDFSRNPRNHQWIELYNPGSLQNVGGYRLYNGSVTDSVTLSDTLPSLNGGGYLVIHFAIGRDTVISSSRMDIYVNKPNFFNVRFDACALRASQDASQPCRDLVSWNLTGLAIDSVDTATTAENSRCLRNDRDEIRSDRVRRVKPSNAIGPLLSASVGTSIGRDANSTNSITLPPDVNLTFVGGKDAAGPTMGRQNLLPMAINDSTIDSSAASPSNWTLMLYFAADNGSGANAQERWCYDILNQIESEIPSPLAKVNVVVWFDSRNAFPATNVANKGTVFEGVLRQDSSAIVKNLLPQGELNSGDFTSLKDFINWTKNRFPTTSHYALALKGDGAGWEGLCGDSTSSDRLEMGELKSALQMGLGGTKLDLLIFDAPLMSQLEVANQVKDFAHHMVASPEMIGPADFDYPRLVEDLIEDATGSALVPNLKAILGDRNGADSSAVWTIINLDNLYKLTRYVDTLAINLMKGVADPCQRGDKNDNYQLNIRGALTNFNVDHYGTQAQGMADFVDLRRFATLIKSYPDCGGGYKNGADSVVKFLDKGKEVVEGLEGGGTLNNPRSNHSYLFSGGGLSIYFPSARQRAVPIFQKNFQRSDGVSCLYSNRSDHPFDSIGLESEGGTWQDTFIYAIDKNACYPHPDDTCGIYSSPNYPHSPLSDFDFRDNTNWDEFLIRYYKPVADAGSGYPTANIGIPFHLNGKGSSDPDDDSLQFFWDLDAGTDTSLGNCSAFATEDMDKDCVDSTDDERDVSGKIDSAVFQIPHTFLVTLNVWDGYDFSKTIDGNRRYQTAKDTVSIGVSTPTPYVVREDKFEGFLDIAFYEDWINRIRDVGVNRAQLFQCFDRTDSSLVVPIALAKDANPIFWQTGRNPDCLFPGLSLDIFKQRLNYTVEPKGAWVFAPRLGEDTAYQNQAGMLKDFFRTYFGLDRAGATSQTSTRLHLAARVDSLPIFKDLDTNFYFPINLRTTPSALVMPLESLGVNTITGRTYPLLKDEHGNVVAIANIRNVGSVKRGMIISSFGLEHINNTPSDSLKLDTLLARLYNWMFDPSERIVPPCDRAKGDMNGDGNWTQADVAKMLNCVYLIGYPGCDLCFADVNCSGSLTPTDVIVEVNRVILLMPFPCD